MNNPRLLALAAITTLVIVGILLQSSSNTTSASQGLEALDSGVAQLPVARSPEGTREVELQTPTPSREPIEQSSKADGPDIVNKVAPVLSREEGWEAKYSAMDTNSLIKITLNKRKEYWAFNAEEVERYVASGMAAKVPLDELSAQPAPDTDTMSVMTVDSHGDGYLLDLKRSESPELFEMRDETDWLGQFVFGVDPTGNGVRDGIRRRRGEKDGE